MIIVLDWDIDEDIDNVVESKYNVKCTTILVECMLKGSYAKLYPNGWGCHIKWLKIYLVDQLTTTITCNGARCL